MLVLGIETSCDETALALVERGRPLGQSLSTQADVHSLFGGVVPEIASREHLRMIAALGRRLFDETGRRPLDLAGIAVARGPGLLGSLLVGLGYAKGLALSTGAPLVGVNHLHAHLLAPNLEREVVYPALGLLISGGHTQIYRMNGPLDFIRLGRTLDDAVGEAFDKAAKALNLPYPGGRVIDELAARGMPDPNLFPRPYLDNDNLDFSFSGLKTAVANYVAAHPGLRRKRFFCHAPGPDEADSLLCDMLASFSLSVAETLSVKVARALDRTGAVHSLVVAGGVAANSVIRARMAELAEERGIELVLPSPALCTDNALMVARAGHHLLEAGCCHGLDLDAVPRGRSVPRDYSPVRLDRAPCE